jgi:carbamoyl-phosphate synthase large subunit
LSEEGIKTILVNPNIATIQTDTRFASKVYLLPVNGYYIKQIIEKETPDSIMLAFGGQTALNCGVSLHDEGVIDKYKIQVLGTPINSIKITEDRQQFKTAMIKSNVPVLESSPAYNLREAQDVANKLGYPVIIRVAYTLGGKGGGVAHNEYELQEIVQRGLSLSLVNQVLIEKYIGSWKQIEYEMMRDCTGNSVAICNMENVLGMCNRNKCQTFEIISIS